MSLKIELQANHAATAWTDITSLVDITSIRFGGRAANGESEQCGFNLEDDAAASELPAHRIVRVTEDATTPDTVLGWGRIQSTDIGRGKVFDGDARQFDVQLTDANGELRGISFDHLTRPAETPSQRMRAALQEFANGVWRPSTVLDRTTYVPLLAFDDMEKKRYPTGKLEDILGDIAATHNLLYFVTNDQEVFLAQQTSVIYASTIAISDAGDDDGETIFAPGFDGPGNARDGDQVSSGIRMQYGSGKAVFIRRSAVEVAYDRWEDVQSLDTTHKGFAENRANSTLDRHAVEESTIRCGLTLRADQVDLIRHGQTLAFRAAAAGILSPLTFRVASLVWEFAGPGFYKATLELNFPRKVAGSIDHTPPGPPLPPFDPAAAGSFTFVEAADSGIDTLDDPTATLSGADEGDLLVAVLLAATTGGAVTPEDYTFTFPDGWVLELGPVGVPSLTDNRLVAIGIAWKIAGASEPLTVAPDITVGASTGESGFLCISRYTTEDAVPTISASDLGAYTAASGTAAIPALTPPSGAAALIVAAVGLEPNYVPTASAGWNVRGTPGSGGPRQRIALVDQIIASADGTDYPGTMTSPGGTDDWWFIPALVFSLEPGVPLPGQPVPPEGVISNGTQTVFQTNYPYLPGSLVVRVNGNIVVAEETDPETGVFTLATPASPRATISWTYQASGDEGTGAGNGPPPASAPATPADPGHVIGGDGVARPPSQPYIPAEAPDGSRVVFTIVPYVAGQATQLDIGTQTQRKGIDWWELDPAAGTVELDEAPITDEELTVWAMPLVATPPTSSESVAGLYGSGVNGDSKANIQMGPEGDVAILFTAGVADDLDSILIQARGGPVYSAGTGGAYDVDLYAADANGLPTGSILAHTTYTPGNPGGDWTSYDTITWGSPETTVLGGRYCAVFTNTDGSPLSNYISINCLFVFGATLVPRQPLFEDTAYAVLVDAGSGFAVRGRFTANVDLAYAGGHHDGMGYIQNMETTTYSGGTHVPGIVNGSNNKVRERFTVSGGDRAIVSFAVRGRRNDDGSDPLTVKLKSGATVLDSVDIPASTFPITDPYNDDGGSAWGLGNWSATLTIEDAGTYDLELSTAAGTTYSFAPIRKGTDEGFDPSLVFMDGEAQFTTNGGSSWAPLYPFDTDAPDLQFYFRVTT